MKLKEPCNECNSNDWYFVEEGQYYSCSGCPAIRYKSTAKKFEIGTAVRVKDGISPGHFEGCEGIVVGRNDKICLNVFVKIIKDKQGNKYQEADFRDRELDVIQ